ncbi:hypothetical protein CHLNCDRAFT_56714 [Chlorella variabilis]|uniref:1,4-alpha-D-glucan glucanohydrolase n=1 Tax=Chlorella variabilis TaxID=554065 RepID=E1Z4J9_CHLVA|nr:hypothetical protein CHLNCDRAFT_56714 [Chlorella variabilis]EFN59358.1 hypothetical protein CHLNCDRAFT_56714 [Chlorella variabilis]|eukprot:XP_005851460.1 hypothetical protein CHLNCDRAFT_56714 [Chlorella variabilis]
MMLRRAPLTGQRCGSLASQRPLRRGETLPRASRASRWRGLLEADDAALAVGDDSTSPADLAVEAARQVAEKAFSQPTYMYVAVDDDEEEEVVDRLWRKLDAVNRELAWVTEAEYLSGLPTSPPTSPRLHQPLAVNNVVLHPHNLPTLAPPPPPVAPPPPPAPEPERQRQPERQPERVVLPDTPRFEGLPGGGKAEGTGKEVLLQGFNWESWRNNWFEHISGQAQEIADMGFTSVWLPPFTDSVSEQGYMPRDLYNLNSRYGSEQQLINCVRSLQQHGIKVLGDAVLNHRCAQHQGAGGVWNQFGGKMTWDERAIVGDQAEYGGRGNLSSGEFFSAAPNIDHSQPFVKRDLCEWMCWLREHVGFYGFSPPIIFHRPPPGRCTARRPGGGGPCTEPCCCWLAGSASRR